MLFSQFFAVFEAVLTKKKSFFLFCCHLLPPYCHPFFPINRAFQKIGGRVAANFKIKIIVGMFLNK